jgi:hypothetical protein
MQQIMVAAFTLFFGSIQLFAQTQTPNQLTLSGDGFVRAVTKNRTGDTGDSSFNSYLRLKSAIKADEFVTVKFGAIYNSSTAQGDVRSATGSTSGTHHFGNNENIRLDYAHFDYFKGEYFVSVGRQAVTSPGSFLTSDERRDRLAVAKFIGQDVLVVLYDKRAEGFPTNGRDDLDMYSVNYYGKKENLSYALQTGWFLQKQGNTTGTLKLRDVKQFTPQLTYFADSFAVDTYYTLVGNGTGDAVYQDWHHSMALKFTKDFPIVKFEALAALTLDGGLIASGFDTLSSVVNNNSFNYMSNTELAYIGLASGAKKADETLFMTKFSRELVNDLEGSFGFGHLRNYSTTKGLLLNNSVVDVSLKYKVTKATHAKLNFGQLFGDTDRLASSLTYYVNF